MNDSFFHLQHGTFQEFCAPVGSELWWKLPPDRLERRCTMFKYDDGVNVFGDIIIHGEGEHFKEDEVYTQMARDRIKTLLKE